MTDREMERWMIEVCRERLKLPPRFSLDQLVAAVAQESNCTIDLGTHDLEGSRFYGLIVVRGQDVRIFTRDDLRPAQRVHVVCHELTHLLRGHVTLGTEDAAFYEFIGTSEQEREAEAGARALWRYGGRGRHQAPGDPFGAFWEEASSWGDE